jgi:hypothetical protein
MPHTKHAAQKGTKAKDRMVAQARPFVPGRAEPPVPMIDDLEEEVAPPLHGKAHPRGEMDEATPTLDDENRRFHHHPNDAGTTDFAFDPEAADAAADLAGDLGATFLTGATRGEDMSDLVSMAEDQAENDVPFVIEEEVEETGVPANDRRRRLG